MSEYAIKETQSTNTNPLDILRTMADKLFKPARRTEAMKPATGSVVSKPTRFAHDFSRIPASRDATFVNVPPVESLGKLQQQAKEKFLKESERSVRIIKSADPHSARIQANAAAIAALRNIFGEDLAGFLWIMRAGGDNDVTIWTFVNALEGIGPSATPRINSGSRSVYPTESPR